MKDIISSRGKAWVDGVDHLNLTTEPYRVIQDRGRGLVIQGSREWRDYRVEAAVTVHMAEAAGIAVRVQGMRRYYALLLRRDGGLGLVRVLHTEEELAGASAGIAFDEPHRLALEARGTRIRAFLDGSLLFDVSDTDTSLAGGAVALVCEEGRMSSGPVKVEPVDG